ncbi:MAG: hypothetical protein ACOC22_00420 [bacterium]
MNNLEITIEQYPDEEFLSADGFEDAIIGISGNKLVYSNQKCIEILMIRDGMSLDEAVEYFTFNVEGAYMGEKTPIWVEDMYFDV